MTKEEIWNEAADSDSNILHYWSYWWPLLVPGNTGQKPKGAVALMNLRTFQRSSSMDALYKQLDSRSTFNTNQHCTLKLWELKLKVLVCHFKTFWPVCVVFNEPSLDDESGSVRCRETCLFMYSIFIYLCTVLLLVLRLGWTIIWNFYWNCNTALFKSQKPQYVLKVKLGPKMFTR